MNQQDLKYIFMTSNLIASLINLAVLGSEKPDTLLISETREQPLSSRFYTSHS